MKISYFFSFFIFLVSVTCMPTISVPNMKIDMIQPVSSQCQNNVQQFLQVQYNSQILSNIKSFGLSLIGFDSIVQSVVNFMSKINQINSTHVQIAVECRDGTIFSRMRFSYILIGIDITYIQIYSDCYLCPYQLSSEGYRKYQFSLRNHSTAFHKGIQISSSISALNIVNIEQDGFNFKTSSLMKLGDNKIYITIQSFDQTLVNSICFTTIVYDFTLTNTFGYNIIAVLEEKYIDQNDQANYIGPPTVDFQFANSLFYGISAMNTLFLAAQTLIMLFDLSIPSNLNANFQGNYNLISITVQAFFIRKKTCLPPQIYYNTETYQCVALCPSLMSPNSNTNYCEICHQTCLTCNGKNYNNCLTCDNTMFRTKISNSCVCMSGYIQPLDGTLNCLKCSNIIQNCNLCTTQTNCTSCTLPSYVFYTTINKCSCADPTKFLANGVCINFPGCLDVRYSLNVGAYCSLCDTSNNFQRNLTDDTCECKQFYSLNLYKTSCVQTCGDGIIIAAQCDDKNTQNGDGCSSSCIIESGYACFYNQKQTKSLCMIKKSFSLKYLYCKREITSNQATFTFQISPPQTTFRLMEFEHNMTFSFPYVLKSYNYDESNGNINFQIEYKQTLQGKNHFLKLSFDPSFISSSLLSAQFEVKGVNAWVTLDSNSKLYRYILFIIIGLCVFIWFVGLLASLLGYKHLAIQLIYPIQATYLVLITLDLKAPGLRALQNMSLINGYHSLTNLALKQITSTSDNGYFYLQYLQNLNYFILLNILCVVLIVGLQGTLYFLNKNLIQIPQASNQILIQSKKSKQQIQKIKQNQKKIQQSVKTELKYRNTCKVVNIICDRFAITILLLSIQSSIYFLAVFVIYKSQFKLFSPFLNNISSIVSLIVGFLGLLVYPCGNQSELQITLKNKIKVSYIKVYILIHVIFTVLLIFVGAFEVRSILIIPISFLCISIFILMLKNPYNAQFGSIWRKILPLFQHFFIILPMIILWITGFFSSYDSIIYSIATFALIGCFMLCSILTCIRICYQNQFFQKASKGLNIQKMDQIQKQAYIKSGIDEFRSKLKQKLQNKVLREVQTNPSKNQSDNQKHLLSQQEDSQSSDGNNFQDLELIKKRLRSDLKSKRTVVIR